MTPTILRPGFLPVFRFKVPDVACPACGQEFLSMGIFEGDDSQPEEGDLMICSGCAALLKLEQGRPSVLTPEEWTSLTAEQKAMLCRGQGAVFASAMEGCVARKGRHT